MFTIRHAVRCANKLAIAQEFTSLHRTLLISKNCVHINFDKRFVSRTQTKFCNIPQEDEDKTAKHFLGKVDRKMKLEFTCKKCNHRNSKLISKVAYEEGVVIVRCDNCKNNHLIADNLGWFEEMKTTKNIERFLLKKGETVKKVMNDVDGYIEISPKTEK
ncbi:DNL-type zinc finger protein [Augochlora pura]